MSSWANMVQIPESKKNPSQSFVGSMGIMTSPEPKMASVAPFWAPEMKLCWSKLDLVDSYGDRRNKAFQEGGHEFDLLMMYKYTNIYIYIWVLNWNQKSKTMVNHMYFFLSLLFCPFPGSSSIKYLVFHDNRKNGEGYERYHLFQPQTPFFGER